MKRALRSFTVAASCTIVLGAPAASIQTPFGELHLEPVVTDLDAPVAIASAGDGRLFVVEREGAIRVVRDGALLGDPFLDISHLVSAGGERGLLGLAFHPDYSENGRFFVDYTDVEGDTVIARYERSASDPDRAAPTSGVVLLEIDQPFANHNGGQLAFGPDGHLYVGTGDGGAANDPACRAQRGETLLGTILRLDVDASAESPPFHGVPPDNPFVGPDGVRDEIWATGLRNPWRFSFDRVTGDLFIADVGQAAREEIDLQPATSDGGENYGWKILEGTLCLGDSGGCPADVPGCGDPGFTAPILEYENTASDCAVVGGHVYRGDDIAKLRGIYLFGDFCSGRLFAGEALDDDDWRLVDLEFAAPGLTSFGEDADGEIFLATLDGVLYRLATDEVAPGPCIEDAATLCLQDGRFRVRADWEIPSGEVGDGSARPITDETGAFSFFDEENVELVVKVIDACGPPFDRFWVFAAGLTNVEVELVVTDTEAAEVRRYRNAQGNPFAPIQDTDAFATCDA